MWFIMTVSRAILGDENTFQRKIWDSSFTLDRVIDKIPIIENNNSNDKQEVKKMSISRKLGILIFMAVPAIIGGGIVYEIFGQSYTAVTAFEAMLLLTAGGFAAK